MRSRAGIVERARLHVGHKETAPNDSILIRAWLRRCGITAPAAWCAAFASWCLEHRDLLMDDPAEDAREIARAGAVKLGQCFPATDNPQPGDLMWFPTDDRGHGHIGIVVDVLPTLVLCIEGNSANRVRYVIRQRSEVQFARTRDEAWTASDVATLKQWDSAPLLHPSYEGTR